MEDIALYPTNCFFHQNPGSIHVLICENKRTVFKNQISFPGYRFTEVNYGIGLVPFYWGKLRWQWRESNNDLGVTFSLHKDQLQANLFRNQIIAYTFYIFYININLNTKTVPSMLNILCSPIRILQTCSCTTWANFIRLDQMRIRSTCSRILSKVAWVMLCITIFFDNTKFDFNKCTVQACGTLWGWWVYKRPHKMKSQWKNQWNV